MLQLPQPPDFNFSHLWISSLWHGPASYFERKHHPSTLVDHKLGLFPNFQYYSMISKLLLILTFHQISQCYLFLFFFFFSRRKTFIMHKRSYITSIDTSNQELQKFPSVICSSHISYSYMVPGTLTTLELERLAAVDAIPPLPVSPHTSSYI